MGYRSEVALKTTTEGWIILQQMNKEPVNDYEKPLYGATIERNKAGFYKISFTDVKWYDGYEQVENFNKALDKMKAQNVPYSFIRIGEDVDDIEHYMNWTDDMPDEIGSFEPETTIYDESFYDEEIKLEDDPDGSE